MAKIKDRLAKIIRDKPRVLTRAIFWKIPHNTSEDEVFLKLGRYNKPKGWLDSETLELDSPKSELTLGSEEFSNLIDFISTKLRTFQAGDESFFAFR